MINLTNQKRERDIMINNFNPEHAINEDAELDIVELFDVEYENILSNLLNSDNGLPNMMDVSQY